MRAADILEACAKTWRERNAAYGNNYRSFGSVMTALFPDGLVLKTEDDWTRMGVFIQIMSKTTRYANNFAKGGHLDSVHDLTTYAAMLEEVDRAAAEKSAIDFGTLDIRPAANHPFASYERAKHLCRHCGWTESHHSHKVQQS